MSYSPQESSSQDGYPQSENPVCGSGGEDPPQRVESRHQEQQQQQQQSISMGLHSPSEYPHHDHPDHSHFSPSGLEPPASDLTSRQQLPSRVISEGYGPNNDLSDHQIRNRVNTQVNSTVDQQRNNSPSLPEHTNDSEHSSKQHYQPQQPEAAVVPQPEPLPVPPGYPPPRPPTSPSKLEPQRKKGCLEKICCCFC
ncbi:hypothetical protein PTKIN_Ptkin16aG0483600 [Pterospermum kingtungense]